MTERSTNPLGPIAGNLFLVLQPCELLTIIFLAFVVRGECNSLAMSLLALSECERNFLKLRNYFIANSTG